MKTKPEQTLLEQVKERILALPPSERRQLSDELVSFLLFDQQSHSTISHDLNHPAPATAMSQQQLRLIKALGDQTRRLNDLMGDDLYFFM